MRLRQLLLFLLAFLLAFACWSAIGQPVAATAGSCPYVIPQRGGYSGEPAAIAGVSVAGDGSGISFAEWDGQAASVAAVCSTWVPTYYGTTAPASCEPPLMFFDTDATAGSNLFGCTSTDTWTALGGGGGVSDHGALTGLGDDDHTQYHTDGRAVTWLAAQAAGGDLGGTYPSPTVDDDGHAHTGATVSALDAGDTTTGTFSAARLPAATTTAQGAVVLSTDGEATAGEAVQADDARLNDARTPTAHKTSHEENGTDELLGEALGTACTDGQVLVANTTGGLACGNPGSASFTTLSGDYGDEVVTSTWDLAGALLELPNSTAPTGTDCDAAGEAGRVHVDTDAPSGQQVYVCEGVTGWVQQGGSGVPALLYVRDQKTSGNAAGASTTTTWNTRTLNTVVENGIAGASLSSNQVTLPAGTYRIRGRAPGYQVGRHKLRLRDITNTATLAMGGNEYVSQAGGTASGATLQARVTLAGSTVLELQHYTEVSTATQGLGVPTSTGETEVYAELWVEAE